ncbi:MAG TPA: ABC transporter permease [Vicinamibacteria bacterium]|nr:ABC transporter permease [Vicinamibacteria bacterium]
MESLVTDVRYAVRRLVKTPGFTLVALITLALGIGANTAIFSVVHGVLLRPLPFKDPDRLYWLWTRHTSTDRYPFQLPEFCDYRDQNKTLESVAGFANWNPNLTGDGPAERLTGLRVSGGLFETLGTHAALGRTLAPADDTPGQEKVAVLTHGLWQRRFGGDPAVVGRPLTLNGEPFTVVGVMERDFFFPVRVAEIAIPLAPDRDPWRQNRKSTNFLRAVGRARPGVSRAQIADDLDGIQRRLQKEFPESYGSKRGMLAVPYREELTRSFSQALWVLLGAVALLLLIACANLANLMLVRATDRRRDMAIRQALGASRSELVRQLLVESALLAAGGAVLGALLARWSVPLLVALSPEALPRARDVHVSLPVLLFTLGAAVLAAMLFGLAPALRAARVDPVRDLKSEGRGAAGTADRSRARGLIVASQVALMMILLTGAGLLLKSFREVMRVEAGFDPGVLTVRLSLPRKDYGELAKVSRFYRQLEARVAALPGVTAVAAVNHVPLNGAIATAEYKVADRPPASDDALPTAQYRMTTPAYFRAMGIPLLAGRAFTDDDREGGAPVVIVSRGLARQSFPDRDPLGRYLLVRDNPAGFRPMQIVGVVGDVRHTSLEADAEPHVYLPYHQTHRDPLVWLTQNQFLVVRTTGAPLAMGEAVRRELQAVDSTVAAADIRASGYYVDAATAARRFSLELLAGFAGLALVMAAIGIYGVVSYTVAQRTREIGVRIALGAEMRDIVGMVVGEGVKRTAVGVVLGLAGALAASHAVGGLLYGVGATDPVTYAAVVALLLTVTIVACLLPAWRAARVNPLVALRGD